jgi:1,4-alpha-glucan branching enzyme
MANSTKGKRRVTFNLGAPGAEKVILAGDFNNWDETCIMNMEPNGRCKKTFMLSPGRYEYKFKVDGRWLCDPENPIQCNNVHGTMNSAIVVSSP